MENVVVGTPTAAAAAAAPSTASQPAPSAASQPAPSASQPAASVAAATSTGTAGGAAAESGAAGAAAPEGASAVGCTAVHMEAAVREWRGIAACLDMVPYSEKGLRMIIERFKCYKHTLGDEQVYKVFKVRPACLLLDHGLVRSKICTVLWASVQSWRLWPWLGCGNVFSC